MFCVLYDVQNASSHTHQQRHHHHPFVEFISFQFGLLSNKLKRQPWQAQPWPYCCHVNVEFSRVISRCMPNMSRPHCHLILSCVDLALEWGCRRDFLPLSSTPTPIVCHICSTGVVRLIRLSVDIFTRRPLRPFPT